MALALCIVGGNVEGGEDGEVVDKDVSHIPLSVYSAPK